MHSLQRVLRFAQDFGSRLTLRSRLLKRLKFEPDQVHQISMPTEKHMMRSVLFFAAVASLVLEVQVASHAQSPLAVHHEANFESERTQADQLFLAQKPLDALPLYEDLCRQDPTVAVFAERYGAGLLAREATLSDPADRMKVHLKAIQEIKRAQGLGDNSAYVRTILNADSKTLAGAVVAGIPLTVGYTYQGKPESQAVFQQAEAAFGRSDWTAAAKLYTQASSLDPGWYAPALYAGDSFFRMKDASNAGIWFSKAIAIDPDRETAYRYWGDTLFRAGDQSGAKEKFIEAVVAEPYGTPPFSELGQWAQRTGHQLVKPAITRPEFTTPDDALRIDPELAASTKDGRSSWIIYQQYRVAHGARTLNQVIVAGGSDANAVVTPSGYRHTIAEEHAALRAMLADIEVKLKSGTLIEADLDPSIRDIRNLEKANALGAWIAVNAADAGIRSDYPDYRAHHRQHLIDYVNTYLVR
jgi:tetratricopeptide (TPR) repeat protein